MNKYLQLKIIFIFIFLFIKYIEINKVEVKQYSIKKCYFSSIESNLRIIHLIITRFMIISRKLPEFAKIIFREDYIQNGIRVMKKYLFPSLENQSCQEFIWILLIGDKANITYIKSLLEYNNSFEKKIIFQKDLKNYIKNIAKGNDILITSRIDYDDRIYFDAVNDVRKAINLNKPVIVYGYTRGLHYYEYENKYYEFYHGYGNRGAMSVFVSLILVLNSVNDTYNIYDLGTHKRVRLKILESYKSFGIKELNYEPAIFDSGDPKFIWVRQKYSGVLNYSQDIKKNLKLYKFNINKFYGK